MMMAALEIEGNHETTTSSMGFLWRNAAEVEVRPMEAGFVARVKQDRAPRINHETMPIGPAPILMKTPLPCCHYES